MRAGILVFTLLGLLCLSVEGSSFTTRTGRQMFNRLTDYLLRIGRTKQQLCRVDNAEGVCVSGSTCQSMDGKYAGFCGASDEVCCIVRKSCGDETGGSLTYFENPKYPNSETEARSCDFDIKVARGMCAVRLEMDNFELGPYGDGSCTTDTLTILGSGELATPVCGLMTNWTTTIRVKEFSEVKLAMVVQGDPAYRFSIRVIQIPCNDIVVFHSPSHAGILNEDAEVYVRPTTTTPEPTTTEESTETTTLVEEDFTTMDPMADVTDETQTTEGTKPKPTTLTPGKIEKPVIREVVIDALEGPEDLDIEGTTDSVPVISLFRKIWEQRVKDRCWEYERESVPTERVIGGDEANINEYPWQVALVYNKKFFCGGSIITDRHVLTAAHCVFGSFSKGVYLVKISIGDHDLSYKNETRNVVRRVKKIHWHLNYSPHKTVNDIAILELDSPVTFSYHINAVRLPTDLAETYDYAEATVTGWGRYDIKTKASSPVMKEFKGPLVEINQCLKMWKLFPGIDPLAPNNICLNVTMGTPCHGDSGGPLVVCTGPHCTQVGVVSFGFPLCTNVGLPAVFSRVTYYKSWIDAILTPLSYTILH